MRTLSDIQKRILSEEYPNMSLDSDTDVERYFELRQAGRQADALALYDGRLKRKYPDEIRRSLLMRYYRSRDPRFQDLLRESLASLADRLLSRTNYVISLLSKDIETVDLTDAYSVIKLAEGLLGIISPDRYQAIAFTERYARYAKALNFRQEQMEQTAELIRLYVTDTIESVQEFKKEREERRKQHSRAQESRRRQRANFDLSRIEFSEKDLERIRIPANITRTEDIVIAYCARYWNLVADAAFEKTVFLYSRKYRTNHSDIFLAIKNGRMTNRKDEEILNTVLSQVVTGYYYNISGDLYLQRAWARCKASIQVPAGAPETAVQNKTGASTSAKRARGAGATGPREKKAGAKANKAQRLSRTGEKAKQVTPFRKETPARGAKKGTGIKLPPAPSFTPNSVSDIIKKKTGKTYTVYKELFFRSIRPSIRAILSSSRTVKSSMFGNNQNDAEEQVYGFLDDHYSDPYLNWNDSPEREETKKLGYDIPEIEPLIEHWIRNNAS